MHYFSTIAVAALLAGAAPQARSDTMYKCIAANGKVAYASQPCGGQAREARQFAVPPPESLEAASARLKGESERLRAADKQFRQRQADSNAELQRASRNAPRARSAASQQREAQQSKQAAERAHAAKLNAARIGNCTTRRPEANCL